MNTERLLGNYTFHRLARIRPESETGGRVVQYMPQSRFANPRRLPLHINGSGPFCRFAIPDLPAAAGVYAITANDSLKYIGECADLSERFGLRGYGLISPRNCFVGGQSTNCRINHHIFEQATEGALLELWFMPTGSRKVLERELLLQLAPPWNA